MKRIDINEFRKSAAKRSYIEKLCDRGRKITAAEVAEMLEITVTQVKRLAWTGELPSYTFMRKRLFYYNEIQNFIEYASLQGR